MSDLVEQVARQMARSLNPGNVAAVEAHWPAFVGLARTALSVLEPRIEQLERELAGHYDAEYIKTAIPRAARAAIRNGEAEQ